MHNCLLSALLFATWLAVAAEEMQDLYCGDMNCYERLGVERNSAKSEIIKAYRKLASKYHPDRQKTEEEKLNASQSFMKVAAAYEVLKEEDSREEYNYMLDNPDEMWRNYYRYYRRRVGPKVDVRLVICLTIALISLGQYYSSHAKYRDAIEHLATVPKYRMRALELAKEKGMLSANKSSSVKSGDKEMKAVIKAREERVVRQIVEEKMMIGGACAKPNIYDVLAFQMVRLPLTVYNYSRFYLRWVVKFWILRHEYTEEDKLYLIRRHLKMSPFQFESVTEDERQEYLDLELWQRSTFDDWKAERDEEARLRNLDSGKYKQYKRYMRRGGPDKMTFDDS